MGGSEESTAYPVSTGVSRRNAGMPVSISCRIAPKLNTSERWSTAAPRTCSGDMYAAVPTIAPDAVAEGATGSAGERNSFATPKSRIFTRSSRVMKTFSGFRSRCTTPFAWAAASPAASCCA